MKTLILARHANASNPQNNETDIQRQLDKSGLIQAAFMAKIIVDLTSNCKTIVSSPASRTISTAKYYADALGISTENIETEPAIYNASHDDILDIINNLDNNIKEVIIIGHNPGLSHLTTYLSGEPVMMPTCGVAKLNFDFDQWEMVSANTASLEKFTYPKEYSEFQNA